MTISVCPPDLPSNRPYNPDPIASGRDVRGDPASEHSDSRLGDVTLSKTHSTGSPNPAKPKKPDKPYPEFPLTAHAAGYSCHKICGKIHYFGPYEDPEAALKKYEDQKDALHSGKTSRPDGDYLTVKDRWPGHSSAARLRTQTPLSPCDSSDRRVPEKDREQSGTRPVQRTDSRAELRN
jgi:hypothetical protein